MPILLVACPLLMRFLRDGESVAGFAQIPGLHVYHAIMGACGVEEGAKGAEQLLQPSVSHLLKDSVQHRKYFLKESGS